MDSAIHPLSNWGLIVCNVRLGHCFKKMLLNLISERKRRRWDQQASGEETPVKKKSSSWDQAEVESQRKNTYTIRKTVLVFFSFILGSVVAGFLLRFQIARTTLKIAGTKNCGGAAILARYARSG